MNKKIFKYLLLIFFTCFCIKINDVNASFWCGGEDAWEGNAASGRKVIQYTKEPDDISSAGKNYAYKCRYPSIDVGWSSNRTVQGFVASDVFHLCIGANGTTAANDYELLSVAKNHAYSKPTTVKVQMVENGETKEVEKQVYICPIIYMGKGDDKGNWTIGNYEGYQSYEQLEPYWWDDSVIKSGTTLLCLGTEENEAKLYDKDVQLYFDIIHEHLDLMLSVAEHTVKQPTYDVIVDYKVEKRLENACEISVYEQIKNTPGYNASDFSEFLDEAIDDLMAHSFTYEASDQMSIDYKGSKWNFTYGSVEEQMSEIVNDWDVYGNNTRMTCHENCGTKTTNYCNTPNYKKIDGYFEKMDKLTQKSDEQSQILEKCQKVLQLVDPEKYNANKDNVDDFINAETGKSEQMKLAITGKIKDVSILGSDTIVKDCEALLDKDLQKVLKWALAVVRIGAPILLIVMITVDFGQAVISQDQDAIKKATSKAVKRAVAAIALFFIPYIVELLLDMIGITNGNCGL